MMQIIRKLNTFFILFLLVGACSIPSVQAHPIQYHMQPLDAETVERVIASLDRLISELERAGAMDSLRGYQDEEGPIPFWMIQGALADSESSSLVESPGIKRALMLSGYADSPFLVEEWQLEVDRVLDVYASLKSGRPIGEPAHDHINDRQMVASYIGQLDALAGRVQSG